MSFISSKNLNLIFDTKDDKVQALANINISIDQGDFISLIGPSGCGKTSLLRIIADLEKPTTGNITIDNKSPDKYRKSRKYGYVFQSPALYPWRTVAKNIQLPLEIFGVNKKERVEKTTEILKLVQLEGFEKKYPWQLSGGMQQRVSIARALIFQGELLLMDEPFGALDAITREDLNSELYSLWKKTSKTILFVTHSVAEAVFLSNKIFVFSPRPGKIVEIIEGITHREKIQNFRDSQPFIKLCHKIRQALNQASS